MNGVRLRVGEGEVVGVEEGIAVALGSGARLMAIPPRQ
jgi:hypothetical protein